MSVHWTSLVWHESRARGRTLLVLLAIADHADQLGVAFPSMRALAKKARCSIQTAVTAVNWLEAHGELKVQRGKATRGRNRYYVLPAFGGVVPTGRTPQRSSSDTPPVPATGTEVFTPLDPIPITVIDSQENRQGNGVSQPVPIADVLNAARRGWAVSQ